MINGVWSFFLGEEERPPERRLGLRDAMWVEVLHGNDETRNLADGLKVLTLDTQNRVIAAIVLTSRWQRQFTSYKL